jgi:hypothetical protein
MTKQFIKGLVSILIEMEQGLPKNLYLIKIPKSNLENLEFGEKIQSTGA